MSTEAPEAAPYERSDKSENELLLEVDGLQKYFPIKQGVIFQKTIGNVKAVDGISLEVRKGETLGLVGESGCGKSTAGKTIVRLLEPTAGSIKFEGEEIANASGGKLKAVRRDLQMIFQDPYSSLNPRHTVAGIVSAPYRIQGLTPPGGMKKAVQDLLELVGLNPEHYNRYPHEFSGGQRQRIGVARALALRPKLIVADEPVSALDVSIQAQIVNLLENLQQEFGLAFVFIAHDLSVVRHISDRVAVMYLGHIVETADSDELYVSPRHPYTVALLSAVPIPDPDVERNRQRILLQGDLPSPADPPPGCVFNTRCWKAQEICRQQPPPLVQIKPGHELACFFPIEPTDAAPSAEQLAAAAQFSGGPDTYDRSEHDLIGPGAGADAYFANPSPGEEVTPFNVDGE
jgi:peptide/nickel transport system ATP-binding protein/oligopeptide transport system ATP-binding protein